MSRVAELFFNHILMSESWLKKISMQESKLLQGKTVGSSEEPTFMFHRPLLVWRKCGEVELYVDLLNLNDTIVRSGFCLYITQEVHYTTQ